MFASQAAQHQAAMDGAAAHVGLQRGLQAIEEGRDPNAEYQAAQREHAGRRRGWILLAWGAAILVLAIGSTRLISRLRP